MFMLILTKNKYSYNYFSTHMYISKNDILVDNYYIYIYYKIMLYIIYLYFKYTYICISIYYSGPFRTHRVYDIDTQ